MTGTGQGESVTETGVISIGPPRTTWSDTGRELRATITGSMGAADIWFRASVAAPDVAPGVEPFVTACLLPAMKARCHIAVSVPVLPVFLENQHRIQRQFLAWDPSLSAVEIRTPGRPAALPARTSSRTAAFFSGGVDSFYSALALREEIDDLVFVHGFDLQLHQNALLAVAEAGCRRAAAAMGKRLVVVHTNLRSFTDRFVDWGLHEHGPAMGAVAQWLAPRCGRFVVPGEYFPDEPRAWLRGSQPATDPLLSTEALTVVHHGYLPSRAKKIAAIQSEPSVRENLRVCWENRGGALNCGRCSKCLRNMAVLRAHGVLGEFRTFPSDLDLEALSRLRLDLGEWRGLVEEVLAKVESEGHDPALAAALRRCLLRHRWRSALVVLARRSGLAGIARPLRRLSRW